MGWWERNWIQQDCNQIIRAIWKWSIREWGYKGFYFAKCANQKEGEKILFVPNTAMITSKNAINHPDFGPAIKPFVSTITAVHLLGLYLLFEKQKQKNSTIAPYLGNYSRESKIWCDSDILPSESSSTLYWTEEELELLQASTVRRKLTDDIILTFQVFTHNKLNSMHNRYQEEVESLLFQVLPKSSS